MTSEDTNAYVRMALHSGFLRIGKANTGGAIYACELEQLMAFVLLVTEQTLNVAAKIEAGERALKRGVRGRGNK